jgi:uncharacterized protein
MEKLFMAERTAELDRRLEEIKGWYDIFDPGHDRRHVEAVVKQALLLADRYLPDQKLLVEIAAIYHDVGLANGRDDHEVTAAGMVLLDPILTKALYHSEVVAVSRAVLHHRASTGEPETVLERIIADADRSPISTEHALMRAFAHGRLHHPELDHEGQLLRAAEHLYDKYGPDGYGRRTHFPETEQVILDAMQPIFDAHLKGDILVLDDLIQREGSYASAS